MNEVNLNKEIKNKAKEFMKNHKKIKFTFYLKLLNGVEDRYALRKQLVPEQKEESRMGKAIKKLI